VDIRQNGQQGKFACVYHEQTCVGFLLARGPAGHEAFDHAEHSLGIFSDEYDAITAIFKNDRLSDLAATAAGAP
jgi:hypothetical protein